MYISIELSLSIFPHCRGNAYCRVGVIGHIHIMITCNPSQWEVNEHIIVMTILKRKKYPV